MTWLLILARVKSAFSALLGVVTRYPWQTATIAALWLAAWALHGKHRAEQYITGLEVAQKAATGAQKRVNHEPARKSQAIAEKSDAEAPAYYDSVRRAAADHAVRVPSTHSISRPDLPGADSSEPSVHGPAASADLVCRPEVEDAQIVTAAGRAAEMRQESLDMIAVGVAVGTTTNPDH